MTRIILVLILATLGVLSVTRPSAEEPTKDASREGADAIENAIVEEHNRARQDPNGYAVHLEALRSQFDGKLLRFPGEPSILTAEGVAAVDEAIDYLRGADPLPALISSEGMSRAAEDHVRDQGPKGATGHDGSDGSKPWDRVGRYGTWGVVVGENLSYGPDRARRVVMGLIIDDDVPDRGHRKNIFSDEFRFIGVACGPHRTFRTMCAIDYAADFTEDLDSPAFRTSAPPQTPSEEEPTASVDGEAVEEAVAAGAL